MDDRTQKQLLFAIGSYGLAYLGWGWRGCLAWLLVNITAKAFLD